MVATNAGMQGKLRSFDFQGLFLDELGWNQLQSRPLEASIDGRTFRLAPVAEKGHFAAYRCDAGQEGIPDRPTRMKIDRWVAKNGAREHLIVFADAGSGTQVWQWVKREAGKPEAGRQHVYHVSQPGDSLLQKLTALRFTLEDEATGRTDVTVAWSRVRAGFDVEKVTKRFYERFQKEHTEFMKFLKGIPDEGMKRWYVSVMLNRLMFIYFVQKKGFLNRDDNYLRTKLEEVQRGGADRYYERFLCPLFFQGFAMQEEKRPHEIKALLGDVPYLNGGLFLKHQVEERYGKAVQIPDAAFERLFAFFEDYQWHLDERPLKNDREINPDVLGYIFEKYINQKEMGAYYTKEDITGYISQNTIIPFLLDAAREKCRIAFEGDSSVWKLLQEDPDRYIYDAVKKGMERPLPPEIATGLGDVSKRTEWNKPAPSDYALPTEIWREVVARRKRYEEVWSKLVAGEVHSTDDLITLNLDVRQFAQDLIQTCEGPELLRAVYYTIAGRLPERSSEKLTPGMSILDPTCGSGAFLFAALNVLEPLYEACLERMGDFLTELDSSGEKHRTEKYADFRRVLDRVDAHPNHRYFVFKSIVVNNLYGVDIMEEAVEICKLRLFLKLVAQLESGDNIEPLPDIDFNVRAGNTLVGYASREEVRRAATAKPVGPGAAQYKMLSDDEQDAMARIELAAERVDVAFQQFRRQQTQLGGEVTTGDKEGLRSELEALEAELNGYLAREYGVDPKIRGTYQLWLESHKPFHWFVEFYGIMKSGGFDVIIGNPPYVELNELTQYKIIGYECEAAGNLYAVLMERCSSLGAPKGRQGFIVPVSSVSTDRYLPLQKLLGRRVLHYSSYDDRPSRLFDGLEHIRLTIHLMRGGSPNASAYSTRYNKWSSTERSNLFQQLVYAAAQSNLMGGTMPKLSNGMEASIMARLDAEKRRLAEYYTANGSHRAFYSRKVGYFLQALDFQPKVLDGSGNTRMPSEFKELRFANPRHAQIALGCLNSSLFYWFVTVFSDCRHVNKREVDGFPVALRTLADKPEGEKLAQLTARLMHDLKANSNVKRMSFAHDTITVQCIMPKFSKPIIDEIDRVLAKHYGFTDEELDFIINYDIKYRMGLTAADGGVEEE